MQIGQRYFRAVSIAGFSKIYTAASAIAVLWLINAVAGKAGLGLVMSAYALSNILGSIVASWARAIIMYHGARQEEFYENAGKTGACLFYTFVIGMAFALCVYWLAPWLADAMDKPAIAGWLRGICLMIPAFALNGALTSLYRAQQDIRRMVLYFEIWPATLRLIAFGAIYMMSLPSGWIVAGYIASFLLPFIALYCRRPLPIRLNPRYLSRWDMRHGGQVGLDRVVTKSMNNLVIVLLGFMVSAEIVAQYVLAMRVALFLQFPKLVIAQLKVPRMGRYMYANDYNMLMAEFDIMRLLSLAATLTGVACLAVVGPYLLELFGDYDGAYPLVMLLAIAALIRVGFGALGGYLTIAGYAGRAFIVNVFGLCVFLALLFMLTPDMAAQGAALAVTLSAFVVLTMQILVIRYSDGLWLHSVPSMLGVAVAISGIAGHIYAGVPGMVLAGILFLAALVMAFYALRGYYRDLKGEVL